MTENLKKLLEKSITLKKRGGLKKHPGYLELVALTSFLPDDTSVGERIWYIANDKNKIPTCKRCLTVVTWRKEHNTYNTYCSSKCAHNDPVFIERQRQALIDTHGVDHFSQVDTGKKKKQKTILDKYGVENISQCQPIKDKKRESSLKRFGTAYPLQSCDVRTKIAQTNLEKYGHTNVLASLHGKQQTKTTNLEKYGVQYPLQNFDVRSSLTSTNLEKYGKPHNWCSGTTSRQKQNKTMVDRYGTTSVSPLPSEVLIKLNDPGWLSTHHVDDQHTLGKIGSLLGVDGQTVSNYFKKHKLPVLTRPSSQGERDIALFISTQAATEVIGNTRKVISPYELDMYIPEHKLAIEYCGLYWHSEQQGKDRHYHKQKLDMCNKQHIRLLTIFENEWVQKPELVKLKILSILGKDTSRRIYARQCNIVSVSSRDKAGFYERNHIQGDGPSSINIGLMYDAQLVACMGFIRQANNTFVLNRYASSCRVVGGFSKLLKYFKTHYDWSQIISFADLRWSEGALYETTGFNLDKVLPPDYYYSPDGHTCYHKFNYRRKCLPTRLKVFDPALSERINCDNNNMLRIWDCGKKRYVMTSELY